jgi:hypothetical protein
LHHENLQNNKEEPKQMSDWLTRGIMYLLSKSEDTKAPKKYQPITSSSNVYRLLTGITASRNSHLAKQFINNRAKMMQL